MKWIVGINVFITILLLLQNVALKQNLKELSNAVVIQATLVKELGQIVTDDRQTLTALWEYFQRLTTKDSVHDAKILTLMKRDEDKDKLQ